MAKNKQSKNKKAANFGGLFIQKRTDKAGRSYYVDKQGKRRSGLEYGLQWSKTGRVPKETFEKTIAQVEKFEIKDLKEARLVADDFETLRRAEPLRKREIEMIENELTQTALFFRAVEVVRDADIGGAFIKILTPTNRAFRKYSGVQAIEIAYKFIDSVSDALEEIKIQYPEMTSPLIFFRFQHNIKENTFYIDFKNLVGLQDFILLQQLVFENFSSY